MKVKSDHNGNLLLGDLIRELAKVLRSHNVDFLGAPAASFAEFTEHALPAEHRTVKFNQDEYKLLDQHWGTVFVDWATSKGGRLKSIIGDVRILPSQRTFTSLFAKLIQEEGGHPVVPQVKRMIKFLKLEPAPVIKLLF